MVLLLVVAGAAAFLLTRGDGYLVYEGVEGPTSATPITQPAPESWTSYAEGGPSRMAVLLTDTASSWLGVVNGLRSIGLPFRLTRDYEDALQHRVVLVYPTISGAVLGPEALRALARFPESGGTLIGVNVEGGGLGPVFGFSEPSPSRARSEIVFDSRHALARDLSHERERRIRFGNPTLGDRAAGSLAYMGATEPLAVYDDGTPAITARRIGEGAAYALGVDPGFLVIRNHGNREEGVSRSYVNGFEPSLDVLLRILLSIYQDGARSAVTLGTVPDGKRLTVLMTHDIDYGQSLLNTVDYARLEASLEVPATYFVQTKYLRDWNDQAFLDEEGLAALAVVSELGMEVASHSVAHSLQFNDAEPGTGEERYPEYQPRVRNEARTDGLTVLGELRVSRFLLESLIPDERVVSFRPGHLRAPYSLPEAMAATGYRYSSSVTAGNSLTHLPFRLTTSRGAEAQSPIFEFPVTVEDEEAPPLHTRLNEAVALADELARYGGLFVVMIHTDELGEKLEFERRLIDALRQRDAWFGTVEAFGGFWSARHQVSVDVVTDGNDDVVVLDAPTPIEGLTLRLPAGWEVESSTPAALVVSAAPGRAVLGAFSGEARLRLVRRSGARP